MQIVQLNYKLIVFTGKVCYHKGVATANYLIDINSIIAIAPFLDMNELFYKK